MKHLVLIGVFLCGFVCVGNSTGHGGGGYAGSGYGAPNAPAAHSDGFPLTVFLKLLKIEKSQLISRPLVAIGSVIVGEGARALAPRKVASWSGGWGGSPPSVAHTAPANTGGWGWGGRRRRENHYGSASESVITELLPPAPEINQQHLPYYSPTHDTQLAYTQRRKREAPVDRKQMRRAQIAKETGEFLELALGSIAAEAENSRESDRIFRTLKRAYTKIARKSGGWSAADGGYSSGGYGSGGGGSSEEGKLPREISEYFTLISAFDERTCFEKLFCDIHSTELSEAKDESDQRESFQRYEANVISLFKTIPEMSDASKEPAHKYVRAAKAGQRLLSNCPQLYNLCPYTSTEIMEFGFQLEKSEHWD